MKILNALLRAQRRPLSSPEIQPRRGRPHSGTKRAIAAVAAGALSLGALPMTALSAQAAALVSDPAALVNPFVGTSNSGNTFPGAVAPFGMLAWSPDNTVLSNGAMHSRNPSGYTYDNNRTRGFSLTHVSGAGCAGLSGDIPFFPLAGNVSTSPNKADSDHSQQYTATYNHSNESASPGAYNVTLDSGVDVKLGATTRTGSGQFTYPSGSDATMLVRASDSLMGSENSSITIDQNNKTISGWVKSGNFCGSFVGDGSLQRSYYTVYFTASFDKAFSAVGTWKDGTVQAGQTSQTGGTGYTTSTDSGYPTAGKGAGGYVTFDTSSGRTVNVRVGISYVSATGAQANLNAENPSGTTLTDVRTTTKAAWNSELGRIKIGGGTASQQRTFYSALYHSLLHPNIIDDVDGHYPGFEGTGTKTLSANQQDHQYTTYSGWDVYRSQIQLVTLLDPKRGSDIAQSLFNQANQNNGLWDRWTHVTGGTHVMVGDPSAVSVASVYAFGGTDFDVSGAYESLKTAATVPTTKDLSRQGWNIGVVGQRPSLDKFLDLGYYPEGCNAWGCANETLEVAAADYGIATLAKALGKTSDYQTFATRSQSWQKQYNPYAFGSDGYFQNRKSDGSWTTGFDPSKDDGFVEATAANYVWMVQHNPAGLFDVMGGNATAIKRLDSFFKDGSGNWVLTGSWNNNTHANMDNEPSVAVPWLYNYAGAPWKTQETVRATLKQLWIDKADDAAGSKGIPGNDDLGEMSSWFVFAAMGLYPESPARAELTVAAPLFENIEIHRANNKTLTISTPGAAINQQYIQSMTVDGVTTDKTYLDAGAIAKNTAVTYTVGTTANTSWGTDPEDAPPSDRTGELADNPVTTTMSTSTVSTTPGGITTAVDVRAKPFYASKTTAPLTYQVTGPAGLTGEPATGSLTSTGAGQEQGTSVRLRASSSLAVGTYPASIKILRDGQTVATQNLTVVVGVQGDTLLNTSFESGQAQVTTANETQDAAVGLTGFCCGIQGAETSQHTENAHTGGNAVIYSGRATAQNGSASNVLLKNQSALNTPVTAGSTLSYWIYPQSTMSYFPSYELTASKNVALDVLFKDGTRLSALEGVVASNGVSIKPQDQATKLTFDTWNNVQVSMPASAQGKVIDKILLSVNAGGNYAKGANDGYLRGWIDDVSYQEAIAPLAVTPGTGLSATVGDQVSGTVATFMNGRGTTAADYQATIAWGDGTESAGAITAGIDAMGSPSAVAGTTAALEAAAGQTGSGYTVAGSHNYATAGNYTAKVTITDADNVQASVEVPMTIKAPVVFPVPMATLSASVSNVTFGKAAKVSVTALSENRPTAGTVIIREGSRVLASQKLSAGRGTIGLPTNLAVGRHALTVTFTPAAADLVKAPTPVQLSLSVSKVKATAKAKVSKGKLRKGKRATVTVQLGGVANATPSGVVTLKVGSKTIGKAKVVQRKGRWVATIKTKKLTRTGKVKISYSGNKTYIKTSYKTALKVKK